VKTKKTIESWICGLRPEDDNVEDEIYNIIEKATIKKINYIILKRSAVSNSFNVFSKNNIRTTSFKIDSVYKWLEDHGFKYVKDNKGIRLYRIEEDKFYKLTQYGKPEEEVDDEAFPDVAVKSGRWKNRTKAQRKEMENIVKANHNNYLLKDVFRTFRKAAITKGEVNNEILDLEIDDELLELITKV
jgi:hypothetical protein